MKPTKMYIHAVLIIVLVTVPACTSEDGEDDFIPEAPASAQIRTVDGVTLSLTLHPNSNYNASTILVHPDDANRTFWQDSIRRFQKESNVIVFDSRGRGESSGTYYNTSQDVEQDLDAVKGFLERRNISQHSIIIVGEPARLYNYKDSENVVLIGEGINAEGENVRVFQDMSDETLSTATDFLH